MLKPSFEELPVEKVDLDKGNPRIAKYIEYYGDEITAEAMAMALGKGSGSDSGTSFISLRDSIKAYGGIIHPIIVNREAAGRCVAIEGNTRLLIYREFNEQKLKGSWGRIPAIVYENMTQKDIHSIRLQAHLVGPREWDPYSKAKYLYYLSTSECLTTPQIVDYCGGNKREVNNYIAAYIDMETYYRPLVEEDNFDVSRFSAFVELQQKSISNALIVHRFSKAEFAKWVVGNKFGALQNIRRLPRVLNDKKAKEVFISDDMEEAWRLLETKVDDSSLENASLEQLLIVISKKIAGLTYSYIKNLRSDPDSEERIAIQDAKDSLISLTADLEAME
jgi:hypothetical protein